MESYSVSILFHGLDIDGTVKIFPSVSASWEDAGTESSVDVEIDSVSIDDAATFLRHNKGKEVPLEYAHINDEEVYSRLMAQANQERIS